jgi:hypothetical protein
MENMTHNEDKNRPETAEHIEEWNAYLREKLIDKDDFKRAEIDEKDFLNMTKLSSGERLNHDNFESILKQYYRLKKVKLSKDDELGNRIETFFGEKKSAAE